MAEAAHKTLFEVLGVHPEATDEEVERAFAGFHFGLDTAIPDDVREAYRFLQSAERRDWYRELLRACQKEELLLIPPDQYTGFKTVCDLTQISLFPHPKAANSYAVRLPGQAQPRWTEDRRPVGEAGPRVLPLSERLWNVFESVVLLGRFRRAPLGEKFGLVLLYGAVITAGSYGLRWAGRELAIVRAENLAATVKSRHAEAIDKLAKLEARANTVDSEFIAVTGASFDPSTGKSTKPRPEVDESILRHETVREAWAAIESGRVKPSELQSTKESLSAIGGRIQSQTFVPDDRDRLDELIGWIDRRASKQAGQSRYIKHIKTMVETDQFEKNGQSAERSGS
jgi:hypothetical protein